MNSHDKPSSSEERPERKTAGAGRANTPSPTAPDPGIEGPDGPVDDQPQREDEYLSSMLNEFNPQRKDKKTPLPGAQRGKTLQPGEPADESMNRKEEP